MKKITKNAFFLSLSQIIARLIGFFYFIYLARVLSVSNFGIFAWVLGFVYNFYPLADFGLEIFVLKQIPRNLEKAKEYFSSLLPLRLVLALGVILISSFLTLIINPGKVFYVFLFSLALIPYNLAFLLTAFENARERMILFSKALVLAILLSALFGLISIKSGLGLSWLFLAYFWANFLILLWLFLKAKNLDLDFKFKVDFSFWKKVLKESWVFALLLTIAVFYLRISLVLVGRLLGDYWAGIYGSASKFVEAGVLIPQSLALALFPLSSRLLIENKKKLKEIYFKALGVLFLFSLPLGGIMFFGGKWIIPFIYGQNYYPAVPIFSFLGILMIFLFVNVLAGNIIQNSEKAKSFIPFALINFLIAAISGLVLIPKIGAIGGAWAMVIGETYGLVVNNLFVFKILNEA